MLSNFTHNNFDILSQQRQQRHNTTPTRLYYYSADNTKNCLISSLEEHHHHLPHVVSLSLHLGRKPCFTLSSIYLCFTNGLVRASSIVCLVGISVGLTTYLVYKLYKHFCPPFKQASTQAFGKGHTDISENDSSFNNGSNSDHSNRTKSIKADSRTTSNRDHISYTSDDFEKIKSRKSNFSENKLKKRNSDSPHTLPSSPHVNLTRANNCANHSAHSGFSPQRIFKKSHHLPQELHAINASDIHLHRRYTNNKNHGLKPQKDSFKNSHSNLEVLNNYLDNVSSNSSTPQDLPPSYVHSNLDNKIYTKNKNNSENNKQHCKNKRFLEQNDNLANKDFCSDCYNQTRSPLNNKKDNNNNNHNNINNNYYNNQDIDKSLEYVELFTDDNNNYEEDRNLGDGKMDEGMNKNINDKMNEKLYEISDGGMDGGVERLTDESWEEGSCSSEGSKLFDDVMEASSTVSRMDLLQGQLMQLSGEVGDLNEQMESLQEKEKPLKAVPQSYTSGTLEALTPPKNLAREKGGSKMDEDENEMKKGGDLKREKYNLMEKDDKNNDAFFANEQTSRLADKMLSSDEISGWSSGSNIDVSSGSDGSPDFNGKRSLEKGSRTEKKYIKENTLFSENCKDKNNKPKDSFKLVSIKKSKKLNSMDDLYIEDELVFSADKDGDFTEWENYVADDGLNMESKNSSNLGGKPDGSMLDFLNNNTNQNSVKASEERIIKDFLSNPTKFLTNLNEDETECYYTNIGKSFVLSTLANQQLPTTTIRSPFLNPSSTDLPLINTIFTMGGLGLGLPEGNHEKVSKKQSFCTFLTENPHLTIHTSYEYSQIKELIDTDHIRQTKKDKHTDIRTIFVAALLQRKLTRLTDTLSSDINMYLDLLCSNSCSFLEGISAHERVQGLMKDASCIETSRQLLKLLLHILKTFQKVVDEEDADQSKIEGLLEDLFNRNPLLDGCLMEAIKLLMILTCVKLHVDFVANPSKANYLAWLIFSGKTTPTPEAFYAKRLRFIGESSTLNKLELSLLAFCLRVKVRVISTEPGNSNCFINHYPDDDCEGGGGCEKGEVFKKGGGGKMGVGHEKVVVLKNSDDSYSIPV